MSKKKQKSKPKPRTNSKPHKKGPRQPDLPGMEDRAIAELQDAALSYAEVRDERMELTKQESDQKSLVLNIMKKHGKTHYQHANVVIDIIPEDVKVKVKILEEGEEPPKPKQTDFDPAQIEQADAANA